MTGKEKYRGIPIAGSQPSAELPIFDERLLAINIARAEKRTEENRQLVIELLFEAIAAKENNLSRTQVIAVTKEFLRNLCLRYNYVDIKEPMSKEKLEFFKASIGKLSKTPARAAMEGVVRRYEALAGKGKLEELNEYLKGDQPHLHIKVTRFELGRESGRRYNSGNGEEEQKLGRRVNLDLTIARAVERR